MIRCQQEQRRDIAHLTQAKQNDAPGELPHSPAYVLQIKSAAAAQQHPHGRRKQHRRKIPRQCHYQAHGKRHSQSDLQSGSGPEPVQILLPDIQ